MNLNQLINEYAIFANFLADESEKIIMKYFRKKIMIENKNDDSPVTIADKKSELKIRKLINKKYPNHGILAEEFKNININSEFVWVVDPIDGTRSFISGHKDFGTLISLLYKNKPVLGIINCPAHKERWVSINKTTTTLNGKKIKTSSKRKISECYAFSSGLYFENKKFNKEFKKIIKKVKTYRLGGDCYSYGLLASGLIDIVIEDTLKPWDYMALIPIIENAGGIVSDKFGNKIDLESNGSFVASCSIEIHKQLIEIINS